MQSTVLLTTRSYAYGIYIRPKDAPVRCRMEVAVPHNPALTSSPATLVCLQVSWGYVGGSQSVEYVATNPLPVGVYAEKDGLNSVCQHRPTQIIQFRFVPFASHEFTHCDYWHEHAGLRNATHFHAVGGRESQPLTRRRALLAVLLRNHGLRDIPSAEHPMGRAGQSNAHPRAHTRGIAATAGEPGTRNQSLLLSFKFPPERVHGLPYGTCGCA